MPAQFIEVLGVYALPFSARLAREQFEILWDNGSGMSEPERVAALSVVEEQLRSTVLIELLVRDPETNFDVSGFSKPERDLPRHQWQAPWAERFLTADGSAELGDQFPFAESRVSEFRVAFYIHFWNSGSELFGPTGPLVCPETANMPERLKRLVPYPPVD